ncbi:MAG: hypothetical protein JKY95_18725 [Planctomycetaceae bacterium]|nr:hypothetical protein [Planctomycetaceae bacterium]
MVLLDYIVISVYFLILIAIGFISSRRIKKQEDYFLGGRSFGKLLQTFAAFGAGTGSSDPVNVSRTTFTGGKSVFWSGGVAPIQENVKPMPVGEPERIDDQTTQTVLKYADDVEQQGEGNFRLEFLLYQIAGIDLSKVTNATLATLELPPKIITPFLVMIFFSLLTKPNSKEALDRYYAKMKTPAHKDREADLILLEKYLNDPQAMEAKKLFPGTSLEFQRPTKTDVIGFIACFIVCFAVIAVAILLSKIGA